jgi:hypothetical protein
MAYPLASGVSLFSSVDQEKLKKSGLPQIYLIYIALTLQIQEN